MSSVYRDIRCSSLPIVTHLIWSWDLIIVAHGSIAMANNAGDIGHHCLVPLERRNGLEQLVFVFTVAIGELQRVNVQCRNLGPKLNLLRTNIRYFHSTLSNTFSALTERITFRHLIYLYSQEYQNTFNHEQTQFELDEKY